jgi:hypothetical protein
MKNLYSNHTMPSYIKKVAIVGVSNIFLESHSHDKLTINTGLGKYG